MKKNHMKKNINKYYNMNFIINPNTQEKYSIFSEKGKTLLKKYLLYFNNKKGGAQLENREEAFQSHLERLRYAVNSGHYNSDDILDREVDQMRELMEIEREYRVIRDAFNETTRQSRSIRQLSHDSNQRLNNYRRYLLRTLTSLHSQKTEKTKELRDQFYEREYSQQM